MWGLRFEGSGLGFGVQGVGLRDPPEYFYAGA